jgi:hypothetical protein
MSYTMDKLQLTGQNFRSVYVHTAHLCCHQVKLPNLKMKLK